MSEQSGVETALSTQPTTGTEATVTSGVSQSEQTGTSAVTGVTESSEQIQSGATTPCYYCK